MKKGNLIIIVFLVLAVIGSYINDIVIPKEKIAYVDNVKILKEYKGMEDAHKSYQEPRFFVSF